MLEPASWQKPWLARERGRGIARRSRRGMWPSRAQHHPRSRLPGICQRKLTGLLPRRLWSQNQTGAAVQRALSLSADLEAARTALRSERVAHATSSKSLEDAQQAVASLGVGLASLAKSLSDERLARRSLHERLKAAGDIEARLSKMQAEGKLLREDAEATRESLSATRDELGAANAANATLTATLDKTRESLRETESELQTTREQLKTHTSNLQNSEAELLRARAESTHLKGDLHKAEEEKTEASAELKARPSIHTTHAFTRRKLPKVLYEG